MICWISKFEIRKLTYLNFPFWLAAPYIGAGLLQMRFADGYLSVICTQIFYGETKGVRPFYGETNFLRVRPKGRPLGIEFFAKGS